MPGTQATQAAAFCLCLLAPVSSAAQSPIYLRLSPELGLLRIEHTKRLTDSSGSSSNTATATGADFVANLSIGHLAELSGNWLVGGEFQFAVSSRQAIGGSMPVTGSGPGGVGPGTWDFSNRVGVGANLFVGRELPSWNLRSYILVGIKRWTTETTSGALDPELGEFTDRDLSTRWPWTVGIGITLLRERRVDIRLRYFRSVTDWGVTRPLDPDSVDPQPETLTWEYKFTGKGFGLQVGFGTG